MNRAARRLHNFRSRPSGLFLGELERQGLNRAYQDQMRSQMEREANGQPIDPEVAARMTKEKAPDMLWQVGVTEADGSLQFLGPMMSEDAVRNIVSDVNRQIAAADRRDWTKADAYPMTPISTGVN